MSNTISQPVSKKTSTEETLLSVFATHTVTVHERGDFYKTVGLDPHEYDREVIRKTNETSARAFPVTLNTEHLEFFPR